MRLELCHRMYTFVGSPIGQLEHQRNRALSHNDAVSGLNEQFLAGTTLGSMRAKTAHIYIVGRMAVAHGWR